MARGWASKSVDDAQQEMLASRTKANQLRASSAAQMEVDRKRDGFELQRTRVLREIENCKHDRVRKTLEDGLAFLDVQIAGLEPSKLKS